MADGSIIIDTKIDSSGAEKGISGLGNLGKIASGTLGVATKATMAMAAGATAAAGAVTVLVKSSVEQYAQYEQLVGGVETLFKSSSNTIMEYANNAYKTAGLSANEYMNTITGFSASLLQGLGGDTAKAAEIGNQAVIDMSDNANKMGTNMESIQNAYQGFAKNNYTMLDNLKLGYGGTKEEMQRLLVDAEKLTGVKYDINNFSDVILAIHAIQDEIGITGTTTAEAMSTIEGSLGMTKAAWTNMLTGMSDENANFDVLIANLVESAGALMENLLPRIEIALEGVGQLIAKLLPVILSRIPELISSVLPGMLEAINGVLTALGDAIIQSLPQILDFGIQLFQSLLDGILSNIEMIAICAAQIVMGLANAILTMLPQIIDIGLKFLIYFIQGIAEQLPSLMTKIVEVIQSIIMVLVDNFPLMIETGIQLLMALINGLVEALPMLIEMLPTIINTIITVILDNLPMIINAGIQLLMALIDGIIECLPVLIEMLPTLITTIVNTLIDHLDEIILCAIELIGALIVGLVKAIPALIAAVPQLISAIIDTFTGINWGDIGLNIIKGIGEGLLSAGSWLMDKAKEVCGGVVDGIKGFFGIHSPSRLMRDEIGEYLPLGIGVGFDKGSKELNKQVDDDLVSLYKNMKNTVDFENSNIALSEKGGPVTTNPTQIADSITSNKPSYVKNEIYIDGKKTMESIAPYQEVLEEYNEGRT